MTGHRYCVLLTSWSREEDLSPSEWFTKDLKRVVGFPLDWNVASADGRVVVTPSHEFLQNTVDPFISLRHGNRPRLTHVVKSELSTHVVGRPGCAGVHVGKGRDYGVSGIVGHPHPFPGGPSRYRGTVN